MELAMIGLGRMGGNMAQRLLSRGHTVTAYDRSPEAVDALASKGATAVTSLDGVWASLRERPRVAWVMLPAGEATSATIASLAEAGEPGDIIVDGGNSNWQVAQADAAKVKSHGLAYVDVGVSGGIWGLENGYCLMAGGEPQSYRTILPILESLAPPDGLVYCGAVGAGHFVKMVHNGIEYGLMQAYAEGFEIMRKSQFDLDLAAIAGAWRYGSVVRSWLLELLCAALAKDPHLDRIQGWVDDSGEGRWTAQAAIDEGVSAPVIALSLFARFASREPDAFANKILAALRNEFGGHPVLTESAGGS